jgi:hypothetical protein
MFRFKTFVAPMFLLGAALLSSTAQALLPGEKPCTEIFSELVTLWNEKGRAAAIERLNTPGAYDKTGQWVVIYDTKGTAHAVAPEHDLKGMNLYDLVAPNGVAIVQEFIKTMPKGGRVPVMVEYVDTRTNKMNRQDNFTTPLMDGEYFLVCSETL